MSTPNRRLNIRPGVPSGSTTAPVEVAALIVRTMLANRELGQTAARDAVMTYAEAGLAVLPLRWHGPQAKAPLNPGGHLSASTAPGQVLRWWATWEDALIGLAIPEGVVVVDIDPRNGGSLEALEKKFGPLPPTLTVTSGRGDGGKHLYFSHEGGGLLGHVPVVAGVDVKTRGYMIAPPSLHPATGQPYTALVPPSVTRLPTLPDEALRTLVRPEPATPRPMYPYGRARGPRGRQIPATTFVRMLGEMRRARPGSRNSTLYRIARRVCGSAGTESTVTEVRLSRLATVAKSAGLPGEEVARTINSARSAEQ